MKLRNSTYCFSDYLLRRLVSWCCRQVGLPATKLRVAQFRNRSSGGYSGHAYTGQRRIVVSIGPADVFPLRADTRDGMSGEIISDQIEALIAVTSHEIEHIRQGVTGDFRKLKGRVEARTRAVEIRVLRIFRQNRDTLLNEWSMVPVKRSTTPKPSVQQRRATKAQDDLDRWQKKLKMAQTKVKKYRQRVRYYERTAATRSTESQ